MRAQDVGVGEIARRIGRDASTISREVRRNAATRAGKPEYRALVAQWKAQQAAKRPKTAKLVVNPRLQEYVRERLSGDVRRPDGASVAGPTPPAWKGLNKPQGHLTADVVTSERPASRRSRALGGESPHRYWPLRDRHPGGT